MRRTPYFGGGLFPCALIIMLILFMSMNFLNIMVARMTTPDKDALRDPVCGNAGAAR